MDDKLSKTNPLELVKLPEKRLAIYPEYFKTIESTELTEAIKSEEVDVLVEDCNNLLTRGCLNEDDAADFATNIANSGKLASNLDKKRLKMTESVRGDLISIKRLFDENIDILNIIKFKLTADYVRYTEEQAEIERKRIAEEQRKAAEAEKVRLEDERRQAEENAAQEAEETLFDDDKEDTGPQPVPEPIVLQTPSPVTVEPARVKTSAGTVKVVEKCTAIVVDKSKVPEEFKDVNTVRVETEWRAGRKTIPGIRFEVTKTTERSR